MQKEQKTRKGWWNVNRIVLPGAVGSTRQVNDYYKKEVTYFDIDDTLNLTIDEENDSALINCEDDKVIIAWSLKTEDKHFIIVKRLSDGEILSRQEVLPLSEYEKLKLKSIFLDIHLLLLPGSLTAFASDLFAMGIDLSSLVWDEKNKTTRFVVYCRHAERDYTERELFKDMDEYKVLQTNEEKSNFMCKVASEEFKYDRLKAYMRRRREIIYG